MDGGESEPDGELPWRPADLFDDQPVAVAEDLAFGLAGFLGGC